MADSKDTIYIDIDDEITTIIDKLQASSSKIVALVLPKRAATLQSIVNMKLLKRAADNADKNLVLVTTEAGLLPLAGAVGLYVAKTPTSRPEIPAAPASGPLADQDVDEDAALGDDAENDDQPLDESKPVGELAGAAALAPPVVGGIETLELDNADEAPLDAAAPAAKTPKSARNKKLAVPNFDRFRALLLLGGLLLVILILFLWLALSVWPHATINVKTDASNVNTNVNFSLSSTATALDTSAKVVPAKQVQVQKTYSGQSNTTGQKNNGQSATGSVNMNAGSCSANVPNDVPAGTGVSTGGKTYITQSNTSFVPAISKGHCSYVGSQATPITAQNPGASYNTGNNASFSVGSGVSASGSASGGTDNIQQVVAQADIDAAKAKIKADDASIQSSLASQLDNQGMYAINVTYNAAPPNVTTSNNVGDAANNVTVTETVTYSLYGANYDDLKTLVDKNIQSQIDTSKQGILSEGISQSAFKVTGAADSGVAMNVQTVGAVGPNIDVKAVAKAAAGQKAGDIQAQIKDNPDVTDVSVKFSPFWVNRAPKNPAKIKVVVAKPSKTANAR